MCTIAECQPWRGDGNRPNPAAVGFCDVGEVQHQTSGNPQPALPPRSGERQMQVGREVVGEFQQDERGLVREDADPLRPEPGGNEVFVLTRGEVDQPVDASPHADHAPCAHVLEEELRGVASRGGLPGREVALLRGRGLEEQVPIGLCGGVQHARFVTQGYVLCNGKESRSAILATARTQRGPAARSALSLIRADADAVADALRSPLGVGAEDERAANDARGDVVELDEAGRGARSDPSLDDGASRIEEVEGDALRVGLKKGDERRSPSRRRSPCDRRGKILMSVRKNCEPATRRRQALRTTEEAA